MHFHGVRYKPSSDGAYVPGFSGRDADVKPGQSWTYRLTARADSVGVWPYHDHSPSMDDSIVGGMYGMLSILGRHEARPDREFVVVFAADGRLPDDRRARVRRQHAGLPVAGRRPRAVGRDGAWAPSTTPSTSTATAGWRRAASRATPRRSARPSRSAIRWREEDPGTWLYHCHVEEHMMAGMIGIYRVTR